MNPGDVKVFKGKKAVISAFELWAKKDEKTAQEWIDSELRNLNIN